MLIYKCKEEDKKMARIKVEVELKGIYSYDVPSYGYGFETRYIYNMVSEDGTVYVWKTKSYMELKFRDDENGCEIDSKGRGWSYAMINSGDKVVITASVKGVSEYKGQEQTELQRVKVVERTFKAETWEEKQRRIKKEKEAKAEEQRASLKGEDFIWAMPYRQFKEHYSDCETVSGSYEVRNGQAIIEVIVREGRLKNSGVRGKHYRGYRLVNENNEHIVCRAVSEENALRRAEKEFPNETWTCDKIYA